MRVLATEEKWMRSLRLARRKLGKEEDEAEKKFTECDHGRVKIIFVSRVYRILETISHRYFTR